MRGDCIPIYCTSQWGEHGTKPVEDKACGLHSGKDAHPTGSNYAENATYGRLLLAACFR